MTAPPPSRAAPTGDSLALAIWTLGQAAVVALYAAGMKLAGGYPAPPEATADLGLAIAQLVLTVCFAPTLFADAGRGFRTAAIGMTWTIMAALLASRSIGQLVPLLVVAGVWIAAIATWRRHPVAMLALTFLTLAGPVLFYVALEYGSYPQILGSWPTLLSPSLGAAATRFHGTLWRPLLPPLLIAFGPTLVDFSNRRWVNATSEN